jgi:hypothetical protein
VTKSHEGSRCFGRGGTRRENRYDDRDGRDRRDDPPCADAEALPLPPPVNEHCEENQGGYQEPRGYAACLLGGAQVSLSMIG